MSNEQRLDEVRKFANAIKAKNWRAPIGDINPYRNSMGRYMSSVSREGFDKEDIRRILESGDADQLRELSKYSCDKAHNIAKHFNCHSDLVQYARNLLKQYPFVSFLVKGSHAMHMDDISKELLALGELK